jgi:signal transduction histidine kinase
VEEPKPQCRTPLVRYGSVVLGILLVALLREYLSPTLGERSRYILFVPVVLLSALYAGTKPGIFALVLSSMVIAVSHGSTQQFDDGDRLGLTLYVLIGAGIVLLSNRERLQKRLRFEAEQRLNSLNAQLEHRVMERTRQLEAANKELEQFCYSVAHDLRTPMRAIAGNARILLEDYEGKLDEPIKNKIVRMENAANKLGDLVEGLLIYARLASQELAREQVDVKELLHDAVKSVSRQERCEVAFEAPDELVIEADPKMLRIAVNAIVLNTVRYRKPGSAAHLRVSQQGSTLVFQDDGIGFDMQYIGKIFTPFERLHRDDQYPGVGMGLAQFPPHRSLDVVRSSD